jgi:hypothetical protein
MRANFNCRYICRQAPTVLLVALAMPFPAGCRHWAGRPERVQLVQLTENKKWTPFEQSLIDLENAYDESGADAQKRRDIRDQYARKMISVIDQRYENFLDDLVAQRKGFDASADITAISLSTASALFAPVTTKSILAGLSALTTASKTVVSKVYFYEQTLPALTSQMEANRQAVLADIMEGLKARVDAYPLQQTLRDLSRYYTAGTIDGAVTEIQKQAAEKSKDAQLKIRREVEDQLGAGRARWNWALGYIKDAASFGEVRSAIKKWWAGLTNDERWEQIDAIEDWATKDGVPRESLDKKEKTHPEFLGKWLDKLEYKEATRSFLADIVRNTNGIELPK